MVISLLIGTLLGVLAGLGIGGGSLLMLWLTLVDNTSPAIARAINLMFFIAAAGSVSLLRCHKGDIDWKQIRPAIISGCLAAAVCSVLGQHTDGEILRTVLGILFLATGLRELFYRPTKAK